MDPLYVSRVGKANTKILQVLQPGYEYSIIKSTKESNIRFRLRKSSEGGWMIEYTFQDENKWFLYWHVIGMRLERLTDCFKKNIKEMYGKYATLKIIKDT